MFSTPFLEPFQLYLQQRNKPFFCLYLQISSTFKLKLNCSWSAKGKKAFRLILIEIQMCAITFYTPMLFERAVKRNGAGFKRVGQGDNVGRVNRPEETGRTQQEQREREKERCSAHHTPYVTPHKGRPHSSTLLIFSGWHHRTPPPQMPSRSAYDCLLYCLPSDPQQHSTAAKLARILPTCFIRGNNPSCRQRKSKKI